jgi:hypothetical protein
VGAPDGEFAEALCSSSISFQAFSIARLGLGSGTEAVALVVSGRLGRKGDDSVCEDDPVATEGGKLRS